MDAYVIHVPADRRQVGIGINKRSSLQRRLEVPVLHMTINLPSSPTTSTGTAAEFVSVREAATVLRVSPSSVYRIDRLAGPFKVIKRGRRVLIDRRSFDAYLRRKSPPHENEASCTAETIELADKSHGQRELRLPARPPTIAFFFC